MEVVLFGFVNQIWFPCILIAVSYTLKLVSAKIMRFIVPVRQAADEQHPGCCPVAARKWLPHWREYPKARLDASRTCRTESRCAGGQSGASS